jgi:hypothetical protein
MIIKEIKAIIIMFNDILNNTILGGIITMGILTSIIISALVMFNGSIQYNQYATCTATDINETVFVDATGNVWAIDATDKYNESDTVIITFDDNGTDYTREDDIIIEIKKAE